MAVACGVKTRETASLNSAIISIVTAFLSMPLSLAIALISEPRWSIAAAAITPRESETASMPLRFPGVSFIRNSSAHNRKNLQSSAKSYHASILPNSSCETILEALQRKIHRGQDTVGQVRCSARIQASATETQSTSSRVEGKGNNVPRCLPGCGGRDDRGARAPPRQER